MESAGGIGGWSYGGGTAATTWRRQQQQQQYPPAEQFDEVLYVEDEPAHDELDEEDKGYGRGAFDEDDDDESEGYSAHAGFEGEDGHTDEWLGEEGDGIWDEEEMAAEDEEYGVEFAGLVSPTAAAACEGWTISSFDVTPGRRRTSLLRVGD